MAPERVWEAGSQPTANFMELKGYVTYMDYFATGEGRTLEINFCYASGPGNAKIKHLNQFGYKDAGAKHYFKHFIQVVESKSPDAYKTFEGIFTFGKTMLDTLNEMGVEFHLKYYINGN